MKEARLYTKEDKQTVRCLTCAHRCRITSGKKGICGVRENREGVLYSLVYGKAVAMHVDPIEKKPLFHFHPGTRSFSVATVGCNMHCLNCQNADISQMPRDGGRIAGQGVSPDMLIGATRKHRCLSLSYTYTEPAVFWDYAFDSAVLAKENGIKNVFVTNGFFSPESLKEMLPVMDAANVDLKFFKEETYRKICGASLPPVLDTIQAMKKAGVWVEVTTLLIPGLNDSPEELKAIAEFICRCDPGIPWHISRFHPTYRMTDRLPTPVESLLEACEIGKHNGIRYVYAGNVPGEEGENTHCHHCHAKLIHRWGFDLASNRIIDGKCPECGSVIDGVW